MTLPYFLVSIVAQGVALSLAMSAAWSVWRRTGNSGWIDAVWTAAIGVIGAATALAPLVSAALTTRQIVVALLIAVWSARLGAHIVRRSATKSDDPRYGELVGAWGAAAPRRMFVLLQKQALVSIPLTLAILVAAHNPAPWPTAFDWLALAIYVAAIAGESSADAQLRAFAARQDSPKVCDVGWWRYSRHPNYFFEWTHWLVYPLMAVNLTGVHPHGWLAIGAPVCMYWLLTSVSGVPPLEDHMTRKHGDAYRVYQARTNAFVPGPPANV